jgi:hypothetical protein
VHRELADLNRTRAYRPDGSVDELYLSQWLREMEGTVEACPPDEQATVKDIREGHLQLARLSRTAGQYETAIQQLDVAERAGGNATRQDSQQSELTAERRLCYLAWVRDLFQQGDVAGAFRLAKKGLRPDDLQPITDLIPRFTSIQAAVTTGTAERRIALTLIPYTDAGRDPAAELKRAIQEAGIPAVKVTADPDVTALEATLSFSSGEDLLRQEQVMAQALPDWPELAFARAILLPAAIEFGEDETWYSQRARYRETIDTSGAETVLLERARSAEQKRAQLQAVSPDKVNGEEAQAVSAVQQQALSAAQLTWQTLLDNSQGTFDMNWSPSSGGLTVQGASADVRRVWAVTSGQVQAMRLDSQAFKWRSVGTVAALAVLSVLILVLVLFLVTRLSH